MTIEQAAKRFEKRAKALRKEGHHAAAHDYQRMANEVLRLGAEAQHLPPAGRVR